MATPVGPTEQPNNTYTDQQLTALSKQSKMKDIEKKLVVWTQNNYRRCKSMRQSIERQWYINLAFYAGKQNIATVPVGVGSSATGGIRLYVPTAPYYRSRPVINRIKPIIRKEMAKLTAQKPSATIIPATSDDRDQAAARAGEQIWDSTYRRKKLAAIHKQAQLWARVCGTGYTKCYWNPTAINSESPDVLGDFCYETITPFHLLVPDMLAVDIEDQPYVIQVSTRTCDWVKIHYPDIPNTPNIMEATDILNDSFLNLVGSNSYKRDSILCYEVWVKPGNLTLLPNGGMFLIIGESLVEYVEGNPYMHQQYPFSKVGNISSGRFYDTSVIEDLVPIQREFNRTRGQIIESKNAMSKPQLIAEEGAIDPNRITSAPGQVVLYKVGYRPPEPLPLQNIPAYVINELNNQLLDFDDISGQHDVSKGNAPPGVTAATAINFLQEQDDTMLAESFQSVEAYYEKLAFQTLSYVAQYWTVPRMIKVTGNSEQFDAQAFKGSDLRSNTDIRIEAGSALPTSKAAKQAFLMDLMQLGFIPPDQGLELMDMGGVQKLYEQLQVDTAQANRENMKMAAVTQDIMSQYQMTFIGQDPVTGQPQLIDPTTGGPLVDGQGNPTEPPLIVPVNSFDNHAAHINAHNNYRKSQEYDNLAPEIKQLFEQHVNQHMMALGTPPGTPDPTTNSPQPQIPVTDPNAAMDTSGATNINTHAGLTGASTPQVGKSQIADGNMPPVGANMSGGVPNG